MANKPAERNTQADLSYMDLVTVASAWALEQRLDRAVVTRPRGGGKTTESRDRMNVYVDGKFRAQLNDDSATEYANKEMAKGGSVFVTRKQFDVSEYMA